MHFSVRFFTFLLVLEHPARWRRCSCVLRLFLLSRQVQFWQTLLGYHGLSLDGCCQGLLHCRIQLDEPRKSTGGVHATRNPWCCWQWLCDPAALFTNMSRVGVVRDTGGAKFWRPLLCQSRDKPSKATGCVFSCFDSSRVHAAILADTPGV